MHPRYLWGPTIAVIGAILLAAFSLLELGPQQLSLDDQIALEQAQLADDEFSEPALLDVLPAEWLLGAIVIVIGVLTLIVLVIQQLCGANTKSTDGKTPACSRWLDRTRQVPTAENDPLMLNRLRYFEWVVGTAERKRAEAAAQAAATNTTPARS